jgi:hypothetical protein
MAILDSLKQTPPAVGSFLSKTWNVINPTRIFGGSSSIGTRTVDKANSYLSGSTFLGYVVRTGLIVGAIAAVGTMIGNFLDRRNKKAEISEYKAATETMRLKAATAELQMQNEMMLAGYAPQQAQLQYGQYEINSDARSDNALRLEQRQAQQLELAAQGAHR